MGEIITSLGEVYIYSSIICLIDLCCLTDIKCSHKHCSATFQAHLAFDFSFKEMALHHNSNIVLPYQHYSTKMGQLILCFRSMSKMDQIDIFHSCCLQYRIPFWCSNWQKQSQNSAQREFRTEKNLLWKISTWIIFYGKLLLMPHLSFGYTLQQIFFPLTRPVGTGGLICTQRLF